MKDYYLQGEEKFGFFTSRIYYLLTKFSGMQKFYQFIMADLKKSKSKNALDIGSGPGDIAMALAKYGKMEVYAVDPSRDMIKIAKKRAGNLDNIHFALGSSRHVPFKIKFGLIFSTLSLHHWAKKEESLIYLSKLLVRGGEIRIYEFEQEQMDGVKSIIRHHAISKQEIRQLGRRTKLRVKGILERDGNIRATFAR